MPNAPKPLSVEQHQLINIVKAAHQTLAVARKTKESELARRMMEVKIASERALEEKMERVRLDLAAEVQRHASNLDEALISAYEGGIPIRRIALDGFGNRYDGTVQQLLVKLRTDGRVGNSSDYQRNSIEQLEAAHNATVAFPEPVDVDALLNNVTEIQPPTFTLLDEPLVLVHADANGEGEVSVPAVKLEMDTRDLWFRKIEKNARPGTPYLRATSCTLYLHPFSGELLAFESKEEGEIVWDHPVARFVKAHPQEARAGYDRALAGGITRADADA